MQVLAPVFRLSMLAMLGGFLLIPGFLLLHVAGFWVAAAAWTAACLTMAWTIARRLRQEEQSPFAALCADCDGFDGSPVLMTLIGLIFFGAGVAIVLSHKNPAANNNVMTRRDDLLFGSILLLTGGGLAGMSVAAGLIRRQFRLELADLDDRIAMRPESAELRQERAALLLKRGETAEAIDALGEAIRLAPDRTELYLQRGEARYILNRNEEAIADLTRVIELEPANENALVLRSLAYEAIDEVALAEADKNRAADLDEDLEEQDGPSTS